VVQDFVHQQYVIDLPATQLDPEIKCRCVKLKVRMGMRVSSLNILASGFVKVRGRNSGFVFQYNLKTICHDGCPIPAIFSSKRFQVPAVSYFPHFFDGSHLPFAGVGRHPNDFHLGR